VTQFGPFHRLLGLSCLAAAVFTPSVAQAYGEPSAAGVPNHKERLLHVLTNQIRQAPHDWPGWDTSLETPTPRGPVALDPDLLALARFHGDDMAANQCFSHESCDGTPLQDRAARFFSGGVSENIYSASHDDKARSAMTAWMTSTTGHRENLLLPKWNLLGTGFTGSGQVFCVQNFAQGSDAEMPTIPGGAVEVVEETVNLIANHFDPDRKAPASFEVILGDQRIPLSAVAGVPGNQTFQATVPHPSGCEPLFFVSTDASGSRSVFPTDGALLVGQACTAEYTTERRGNIPGDPSGMTIGANDAEGGCRCVDTGPAAGWLALLFVPLLALRRDRR
jgi:uncharacterized protein YkwD